MGFPEPLWSWSAAAIAARVRLRHASAVEVARAALERLDAVNPRIGALTRVLADEALAAAARIDAEVARGHDPGPLAGVPVTVKQNVDQSGCATDNGVVAWRDLVAAEDSPVVANLKAAGAVIIGRTNTPAFSLRWDTDNALHGPTFNPFDRSRVPGGSSGGAAAAVACGVGAIAHGNDLGGSVRYPAYCCGVVGIRPTFGRVPAFNATAPAERPYLTGLMSVQGPLARSVDDLELALAAMARADTRDPWWTPAPLAPSHAVAPRSVRVAVLDSPDDFGGAAIDPAVAGAVRTAADWL
ncbi:MAG: amidase, partial [Burkholderiales bacterium]|nr:amidase [Burkholderiales bacterium]